MSTMHDAAVPKTAPKKARRGVEARELDLRARLVRAAAALVDAEGPRAVTLRAVGDAASVSRQAPYLHFDDREALLAAVAEEGLWDLQRALERSARGASAPFEALKALAIAYVEYAASHPHRFRLIFGAEIEDRARHPGLMRAGHAVQALLESPLGRASAEAPHTRAEGSLAQLTAWSVVHGLAHLVVDGRTNDLGFARVPPKVLAQQVAELLTRSVVGGLGVTGGTGEMGAKTQTRARARARARAR